MSIMHVCYIFLRDILIFIIDDSKGSLPEYMRALTADTALSEDTIPMLVLGGIFLVTPINSGVFITLVHLLMVRTPKWVQITSGAFTVFVAGSLFSAGTFEPGSLDGFDFVYDGAQAFPLIVIGIYIAIFLGIDTVLGWSLKHAIHQLASLPPMIAKVLPVLMISVLFIFVNADLWKLANGLSFPKTWAVLGFMIVLAFFVVITTSYERTAVCSAIRGARRLPALAIVITNVLRLPKVVSGPPRWTGLRLGIFWSIGPSRWDPGSICSLSP